MCTKNIDAFAFYAKLPRILSEKQTRVAAASSVEHPGVLVSRARGRLNRARRRPRPLRCYIFFRRSLFRGLLSLAELSSTRLLPNLQHGQIHHICPRQDFFQAPLSALTDTKKKSSEMVPFSRPHLIDGTRK